MSELERDSAHERDPEATNVSPLFDEEATVVAQPVVPLDDRAVAEDVGTYVGTGTAPPVYARAWRRRTQWMVALVASALAVGTIAGIIGLRLYQRGRTTPAPAQVEQTPVQTETQQPAPELTGETETVAPQIPESETVQAANEAGMAGGVDEQGATGGGGEDSERVRPASESVPDGELPIKRGKKGEVEAEEVGDRVESIGPPPVYDTQGPAPANSEAERRARREEERLRQMRRETRERRRERRGQRVDSVRGIFEGRTESPPR